MYRAASSITDLVHKPVQIRQEELQFERRYDKFAFDVTDALQSGGSGGRHELAVRVFDPTEFAHVPTGKQRRHPQRHPSGIWYTSASGIWQTVWLEPVRLSLLHLGFI
jgi:hypothetical protein